MKKNILLILIFLLIITVLILSRFILKNDKQDEGNKELEFNIQIEDVKSASAYFTVQSCINKYLYYASSDDVESILKILDYNYIEQNNINKDNVMDNIEIFKGLINFKAQKMKVERINDELNKYYVKGIIEEENVSGEKNIIKENYYISVILDFDNMIYSIIPLEDGGVFDEETN